jgi:hypothetical protein
MTREELALLAGVVQRTADRLRIHAELLALVVEALEGGVAGDLARFDAGLEAARRAGRLVEGGRA